MTSHTPPLPRAPPYRCSGCASARKVTRSGRLEHFLNLSLSKSNLRKSRGSERKTGHTDKPVSCSAEEVSHQSVPERFQLLAVGKIFQVVGCSKVEGVTLVTASGVEGRLYWPWPDLWADISATASLSPGSEVVISLLADQLLTVLELTVGESETRADVSENIWVKYSLGLQGERRSCNASSLIQIRLFKCTLNYIIILKWQCFDLSLFNNNTP